MKDAFVPGLSSTCRRVLSRVDQAAAGSSPPRSTQCPPRDPGSASSPGVNQNKESTIASLKKN
jgi:hypothetical protein